jgi:hypothetical protein
MQAIQTQNLKIWLILLPIMEKILYRILFPMPRDTRWCGKGINKNGDLTSEVYCEFRIGYLAYTHEKTTP